MKKITVNYAHFWQVLGLEISVTSVYCHGYFKACFGSMKASSRCGTFFGMLIEEGVYKTWSWNFLNQCSLANKTLVLVPWKLREEADIFGNVYRRGGGGDWKTAAKLGMGMFDFTEIFPFICDPILNHKGNKGYRCEVFN